MSNGMATSGVRVKANVITAIGLPSLIPADYLGLTIKAVNVDKDDARPDWWSIVAVHKDGSHLDLAHEFDYLSAINLLCYLCSMVDLKVINHDG